MGMGVEKLVFVVLKGVCVEKDRQGLDCSERVPEERLMSMLLGVKSGGPIRTHYKKSLKCGIRRVWSRGMHDAEKLIFGCISVGRR